MALSKYKDVMQAAERILEGEFDSVLDEDEDLHVNTAKRTGSVAGNHVTRMAVSRSFVLILITTDHRQRLPRMKMQWTPMISKTKVGGLFSPRELASSGICKCT